MLLYCFLVWLGGVHMVLGFWGIHDRKKGKAVQSFVWSVALTAAGLHGLLTG